MTRKRPSSWGRTAVLTAKMVALTTVPVGLALGIGVVGYRVTEGMSWIDALLNASMILTGMGPVDAMHTVAGKVFASGYALFSGLFFVTVASVVLGPLIAHALHRYHLDLEDHGP